MPRMRAIDAAVHVLEREGVTAAFGVPGAAINPLYSALKARGSIAHVLARHVEGASHMAEGYTRAVAGNIGVCIGTSGPGGHRHDHRALFRAGRLDPDPVHHRAGAARAAVQGGLPGGRHRVDREAGDQMGGDRARARAGAARVPAGVPPDALGPTGAGADRSAVRRADGRDRIRSRTPTSRCRSTSREASRRQIEKALAMLNDAERPLIVAGGGIINADASEPARRIRRSHRRAGDPDADGLGHDPRRSSADGRHVRAADLASLRQRDDARVRLRARHRQPLGESSHGLDRCLRQGPQVRPRRHRADADRPRLRARLRHRVRRQGGAGAFRRGRPRMEEPPASSRTGPRGPASAASASARCCARRTSTTCR